MKYNPPLAISPQPEAGTCSLFPVMIGHFMIALGIPTPVHGLATYRKLARLLFPIVSYFPMRMLFYGSSGAEFEPKCQRYFEEADLLAGDFLFMRKYLPQDLTGKTVVTNSTTVEKIGLLRAGGVGQVVTTRPRFEGRSFGTNLVKAALAGCAGEGRLLSGAELNDLIDELDFRPSAQRLNTWSGLCARSPREKEDQEA